MTAFRLQNSKCRAKKVEVPTMFRRKILNLEISLNEEKPLLAPPLPPTFSITLTQIRYLLPFQAQEYVIRFW